MIACDFFPLNCKPFCISSTSYYKIPTKYASSNPIKFNSIGQNVAVELFEPPTPSIPISNCITSLPWSYLRKNFVNVFRTQTCKYSPSNIETISVLLGVCIKVLLSVGMFFSGTYLTNIFNRLYMHSWAF